VDAAKGVRQLMERLKERFPSGLAYSIALDTTDAVTAGMKEIYKTLAAFFSARLTKSSGRQPMVTLASAAF
jgi:multidrug efflux pump subunit AcrB